MTRNELKKDLDLLIIEIELDKEELKKVPDRFKYLINAVLQKKLERLADLNEKIKSIVERERPLRMKKIQSAFREHINSFLASNIFEEDGDKEYFIRNVSIDNENSLFIVLVETEEDVLNKRGLRLYVRFPDGKTISEMKTTNTFVKCLLDIGTENIIPLDIQLYGFPLIGEKKSEKYQQKPIADDLYIITQMSNEKRVEIMEYISEKLNLDLAIELK